MSCLEMGDRLILGAKAESIDLQGSIVSLKCFGHGSLKCTTDRTVYKHRYVKEDIFLCFKVKKSRYFALFVVSGSNKKLLSIDFINIYLFSIFFSIAFVNNNLFSKFFSIDFVSWKSVGLPHIPHIVIH